MNFFIAGTDTNVGKTHVTELLLRALRNREKDAVPMKPIETGGNRDAQRLHRAADGCVPLDLINPICLSRPLAPAAAAEEEGTIISLEKIFASYRNLSQQHATVLIEGAGGWKVPIAPNYEIADLAFDMAKISPLEVLVIALNRLGVVNHTLLTIASIRARGLRCGGFILNEGAVSLRDLSSTSNAAWIARHSQVPFLGEIATGELELPMPLLDKLLVSA